MCEMSHRVLGHVRENNLLIIHKAHNHLNEKAKIQEKILLQTIIEESIESGRPLWKYNKGHFYF